MRRLVKSGFVVIVLGTVITIFSEDVMYFAIWWHEKAGHVKKAVAGYEEFIERHPRSRWVDEAREGLRRLKDEARKTASEEMKRRRSGR